MADLTTMDARPRRRERRQQVATVTASELGRHLRLSRQQIGVPADTEHVFERLPDGRFDLDDGATSWLREPARRSARSKADVRFVDANAELLPLRTPRPSEGAAWSPGDPPGSRPSGSNNDN